MTLNDVQQTLNAEILVGHELMHTEVLSACGADLMSDVLAFTKEKTVLLTGLTNIQVIRTADVSDLVGIIFVRGKRPYNDVLALAKIKGIPVMCTPSPMFEACGRLYQAGIPGCSQVHKDG